jgi:hypothetical protein
LVVGTGNATVTQGPVGTFTVDVPASAPSAVTPDAATGTWTHDDGAGNTTVIRSVSADAGNALGIGSDGGAALCLDADPCNERLSLVGGCLSGGAEHHVVSAHVPLQGTIAVPGANLAALGGPNVFHEVANLVGAATIINPSPCREMAWATVGHGRTRIDIDNAAGTTSLQGAFEMIGYNGAGIAAANELSSSTWANNGAVVGEWNQSYRPGSDADPSGPGRIPPGGSLTIDLYAAWRYETVVTTTLAYWNLGGCSLLGWTV